MSEKKYVYGSQKPVRWIAFIALAFLAFGACLGYVGTSISYDENFLRKNNPFREKTTAERQAEYERKAEPHLDEMKKAVSFIRQGHEDHLSILVIGDEGRIQDDMCPEIKEAIYRYCENGLAVQDLNGGAALTLGQDYLLPYEYHLIKTGWRINNDFKIYQTKLVGGYVFKSVCFSRL